MAWRVNASDVAAAIGRNKYKKPWDLALDIISKQRSTAMLAALNKAKIKPNRAGTVRQRLLHAPNVKHQLEKIVQTAHAKHSQGALTVQEAIEEAKAEVVRSVPVDTFSTQEVTKHVQSQIQCCRGTTKENGGRKLLETCLGEQVVDMNNVCKTSVLSNAILCGRIDGQTSTGLICEIKTRTRFLFKHIPEYENVQMHCYMHMWNKQECVWFQWHPESLKYAIATTVFDPLTFSRIVKGLAIFTRTLDFLTSSLGLTNLGLLYEAMGNNDDTRCEALWVRSRECGASI